MKNTCVSVQSNNIEQVKDYNFLIEYVRSPYALSVSFLKDPRLLGMKDEFGILKYKLNLDEELVEKFYDIMKQKDQVHLEEIKQANEESKDSFFLNMIHESIEHFQNQIDDSIMSETQSLECKYEIVMPYAVRGLLILLMNENFD